MNNVISATWRCGGTHHAENRANALKPVGDPSASAACLFMNPRYRCAFVKPFGDLLVLIRMRTPLAKWGRSTLLLVSAQKSLCGATRNHQRLRFTPTQHKHSTWIHMPATPNASRGVLVQTATMTAWGKGTTSLWWQTSIVLGTRPAVTHRNDGLDMHPARVNNTGGHDSRAVWHDRPNQRIITFVHETTSTKHASVRCCP